MLRLVEEYHNLLMIYALGLWFYGCMFLPHSRPIGRCIRVAAVILYVTAALNSDGLLESWL